MRSWRPLFVSLLFCLTLIASPARADLSITTIEMQGIRFEVTVDSHSARPLLGEETAVDIQYTVLPPPLDKSKNEVRATGSAVLDSTLLFNGKPYNNAKPQMMWNSANNDYFIRPSESGSFALHVVGSVRYFIDLKYSNGMSGTDLRDANIDLVLPLFETPTGRAPQPIEVTSVVGPRSVPLRTDGFATYEYVATVSDIDHVVDRFEPSQGVALVGAATQTLGGWVVRLSWEVAPVSPLKFLSTPGTVRTWVGVTAYDEKPDVWQSETARFDYGAAEVLIQKFTTITCVKGKTSKKVTALKPTCPYGWKRK